MARWTVCSTPDCPELHQGSGRCPDCRAAHETSRGSRQQRGYDTRHDQLRRHTQTLVDRDGYTCWRCGTTFPPRTPFDLGHDDNDRDTYRGPECRPCNRSTRRRAT